jgi:CRP/FNR family transcriptional regulator
MLDVGGLVGVYGTLAERAAAGANAEGAMNDDSGESDANKVWYLRQNRMFAQAADASIESCEHIFKTTLFPKRSLVFDQGDPTRLVYLVKRGRVRIARLTADGKEITVAVLGPGDIFGEETLFDQKVRVTVAVCLDEVLLCTAKADDLFALLSRNPQLALNVAKILSERLDDASATMEDLAYARVPDRLMHVFQRLAAEHGTPTSDGIAVDLRLTHADLASLIGSTRETVTLEMSNLVKAGRIKNDGGRLTLPAHEMETPS